LVVAGPAWTVRPDTPPDTGRQPLAVEAVIGAHAAALIPGVITTTPHARYLALHARLAVQARRQGWTGAADLGEFRDLVRRAEVVLGAVSVAHAADEADAHGLRAGRVGPHGITAIGRELDEIGRIDIARLAETYSQVPGGYLQTYGGIEAVLGLTDGGKVPVRSGTVTTVVDALSEAQRSRLRRDVDKRLNASADWPLPAKLAVGRVVLLIAATGLWPEPEQWASIVHDAVSHLWWTDQEPALDQEHAALATIGLVALHHGLTSCAEPDVETVAGFEELRRSYQQWADWLKAVPEDVLRRYVTGLGGHTFGVIFEQTRFAEELDWILSRSALHEAVDRLPNASIGADSIVHITTGKDARKATLATLDALRDFPDVHVVAHGATEVHGWWNRPRLLLVTRAGTNWRAERWSHLPTGIASYARGAPLRPPDRRWTTTSPETALTDEHSKP